jgi:hypothetical protein
MEASTIILLSLTAPSALLITFFVLYELYTLKIFRMAVVVILAWMASLFERLDRRYEEAAKEIE